MADEIQTVAQRIQQRLRETVSDDITVGAGNNAIYLSGRVPDEAQRQIAGEVARELTGGMGVENDLVVERLLPEDRIETRSPDLGEAPLYEHVTGPEENVGSLNPQFTGQPLETNPAADAGVKDNPPVEPDPVYFAPTGPVTSTDRQGNPDVLGGVAPSAMEGMDVERSAEDNQPGDEALADAVYQTLAEDAATTGLALDITVEQGVAYLRGRVPNLVDAENAQFVAAEVPGIHDVTDETTVEHM
ncbi:MAG TPA: BON domain-containing protein [Ktedonobacterales bacterium]|nr:BON domain-containing protein [Ktedonobacterales bacterium]